MRSLNAVADAPRETVAEISGGERSALRLVFASPPGVECLHSKTTLVLAQRFLARHVLHA